MNEIKVSTENVHKAFHAAGENPEIQELLINLFGKENVEQEQDITERIKTFEDACSYFELSPDELLEQWKKGGLDMADEIAYHKLRLICAALNEGWTPNFTEDEYRWYPWFYHYTQEEIDNKDDDWKQEYHLISTDGYETEYDGFAFAYSDGVPSKAYPYIGSRLCLKSEALATYCGKQFINLWADFNLIRKQQFKITGLIQETYDYHIKQTEGRYFAVHRTFVRSDGR